MDDKDSPCLHAHNLYFYFRIIIVSLLSDLCTCIQVKKMASLMKPQFFSDQFELPREILKFVKKRWAGALLGVKCCCSV